MIVVSNRLPITIKATEDGARLFPSDGGLVRTLVPILRETGGCWVGWAGTDYSDTTAALIRRSSATRNYRFEPVFLTNAERDSFYLGFSNEIIWPLFHSLPSRCQFDPAYWNAYCKVNEKFADAIENASDTDELVWVHDYHLMVLARAIRKRKMRQRLGYFHHISFPPPDVFDTLPWRTQILSALTAFDVLGFQTFRDRQNFIACLHRHLTAIRVSQIGEALLIEDGRHSANVIVCPVSLDYDELAGEGARPDVVASAETIREELRTPIILGVDRLDYTKGIPERLTAFQKLLESNPGLLGRVSMLQIVVPSREEISEYEQLKLRIETLISRINGRYSKAGWVPVHYFYRSVPQAELTSFYRAADIALVTPLKDGMNLVAKEFCACRADNRGVLILSEFAGAAEELKCGAIVVNPYDTNRVAFAIRRALEMHDSEQSIRMEAMRAQLRQHDVFYWFHSFIEQSSATSFVMPESVSSRWASA